MKLKKILLGKRHQLTAGTHRVRGSQTESQMDVHIFPIRQWEDSIPHRPL